MIKSSNDLSLLGTIISSKGFWNSYRGFCFRNQ
ncbi:hypothetical protein V6Z11_A06G100500 [Gossypium hirsutum]